MVTTNCYNLVTTTQPLQTGHYMATTILPQLFITNSLPPHHYKLTTMLSLQPYYKLATTWSLQTGHYTLTTTILPHPGHYNLATTQSLCYNLATTNSLHRGHYRPVTTLTTNSLLKENHPEYTMLALPLVVLLHCCLSIMSIKMSILCIPCSEYMWLNRIEKTE